MILASLVLGIVAPTSAADFFPLTPGMRWTYEEKGVSKITIVDEVGAKPVYFDDQPAYAILRKSRFNQILDTTYYRVEGSTVLIVGYAEDRRASTPNVGDPIDVSRQAEKKNVLLRLIPAMPVFKFDGGPTQWTYTEIPKIQGPAGDDPVKGDETAIVASAKPGPMRDVLGKKVETLIVHAEIDLGVGQLAKHQVENSIYGKGIGLVESTIKTTSPGNKTEENHTTLIGMDQKREGG